MPTRRVLIAEAELRIREVYSVSSDAEAAVPAGWVGPNGETSDEEVVVLDLRLDEAHSGNGVLSSKIGEDEALVIVLSSPLPAGLGRLRQCFPRATIVERARLDAIKSGGTPTPPEIGIGVEQLHENWLG